MGRRLSLLEKISGPDAVPLAILIRRGEAAAERVQEARSFQVIGSHVDALVLLASGSPESCGSAETQTLIAELEQAVNLLPLGKSSLKE